MNPEYFDYISIAKKCNISEDTLKKLEDIERKEFPRDQMMFELHMLRMIKSIDRGSVKPEEILNEAIKV
ncbi:MAG: hypothetical protein QG641_2476 [Candidatus Poribacteria bacterium]|nr:hypothetical protein [Candidatus Poribacteria bacterium]